MYQYQGRVLKVVDGDTYDLLLDLGFNIFHKIRVRLKGVDTEEIFGKHRTQKGVDAHKFVIELIMDKIVVVQTYKVVATTYNRFEADIYLRTPLEGQNNLAEILVIKGLAIPVTLQ